MTNPAITLYYLLQTSTRYDAATQSWLPVGVSSLVIDRSAPSGTTQPTPGLGSDSFSTLIKALAYYLMPTFGNAKPNGSGTGYVVNNSTGYATGATTITLGSGSGTILVGDVVMFGADPNAYLVAQPPGTSLVGVPDASSVVLNIAKPGLEQPLANGTAVTVSGDVLAAVTKALSGGGFADTSSVYAFLASSALTANVVAITQPMLTGTQPPFTDGAVFPMIPGLAVTFNGATTTFGDSAAPSGYLTALTEYFAKLKFVGEGVTEGVPAFREDAGAPASVAWLPGVIFADYFNLLAKQLVQQLSTAELGTGVQGTVDTNLALIDVGNLAGIGTRFLQHGLRIPDPADTTLPLRGLYDLTGQQFDITGYSGAAVTAAITAPAPRLPVTVATANTATMPVVLTHAPEAGPLSSPVALDRVKEIPQIFLLRQGIPWDTSKQLFAFPDPLQSEVRIAGTRYVSLAYTTLAPTPQPPVPPTPIAGAEGLLVRFQLGQIVQSDATGKSTTLPGIFQLFGTDDSTRDLLETLIDGDASGYTLDLLVPASGGGYTTSPATSTYPLVVKTNLSSNSQPSSVSNAAELASAPPDAGPTFALVSDADPTNFLLLLWECSVVHSGGFYLSAPNLEFPSTASAQARLDVALLVTAKGGASAPAGQPFAIDAFHNVIIADESAVPSGARVQAAVYADGAGQDPITVQQPNYPAGAIAFGASWLTTSVPPVPSSVAAGDTPEYAAALYQLLQFNLEQSSTTKASGWSMPLGPNDDANGNWVYRRAVPLYRFANPPSANRYAAIGAQVNVDFQLADVFGNAFAPSGAKSLGVSAVYNDQIIPIEKWPGTSAQFDFTGTSAAPVLEVYVSFHPDQVAHKDTALAVYQVVADQIADARMSLGVTTALASGPVTLTSPVGAALSASLETYVQSVVAWLTDSVKSPVPSDVTLTGALTAAYVAQIPDDLFPIWTALAMTREATDSFVYDDGFLSTSTALSPRLNAAGGDDATPAALRTWAIGFESAFANFDGQGALLKVATGKAPTQVSAIGANVGASEASAVTSTPGDLWALKWSASKGVAVAFANSGPNPPVAQQPVYFAPLPLATEPTFGQVPISDYDSNGAPVADPPMVAYNGIDLDAWGSAFLHAFEGLLVPDLATTLATLNASAYTRLMTAKANLAYAIANNISWVLNDQIDAAGSITQAQDAFREALLASLDTDFATSCIVQMPATVAVANQFEADDAPVSHAPTFFGNPRAVVPPNTALPQLTVSTATLPITAGDGYLNFLVGTANPAGEADFKLPFEFDIAYIDHRFHTAQPRWHGYLPSAWLRFVVPDADVRSVPAPPVLDVPMGTLDIPIPLRAYPSPPRLAGQSATPANSAPLTIGDALAWTYTLQVARPVSAQDDVHVTILGNGETLDRSTNGQQGTGLFDALAAFQDFELRYLMKALASIRANDSAANGWVASITNLVDAVAAAWTSQTARAFDDPAPSIPQGFAWDFILQVPDEIASPNALTLVWNGDQAVYPVPWPTIETELVGAGTPVTFTASPVSGSTPAMCHYTLPVTDAAADVISLEWTSLPVLTVQGMSAAAWIERNETLIEGRETNSAFVYSTQTVSFQNAVVPLLQSPGTIVLVNTTSLSDAVNQLVTQVMTPRTPVTRVGWSLEAAYRFALVAASTGGQELTTELPILLGKTTVTTGAATPPDQTPQQLEADLIIAIAGWYGKVQPSLTGASLVFEVTLFTSTTQHPLARIMEIDVPISGAGWWTG